MRSGGHTWMEQWMVAAGLLVAAHVADARTGNVITPDGIVDLREVDDVRISADGTRLAWVLETPQRDGESPRRRIQLADADGDAPPRTLAAPDAASDSAPRWSPDGASLLFLSDRGDVDAEANTDDDDAPQCRDGVAAEAAPAAASTQLWRVDRDGHGAERLTSLAGDIAAAHWSPDGRRVALLVTDPPSAADRARAACRDDAQVSGVHARFQRLWLLDPQTRALRALSPPGLQVLDAAWSPDGRQFALRVADTPTINDYWYRSRIVLLDADTGALGRTVFARAAARDLAWSPDGRRLLYGELHPHAMSADAIVETLADGRRVRLARDWPGTLRGLRWQDDDTLVALGIRGVRAEFLRIDARDGAATAFASVQTASGGFERAGTGRIAFVGTRSEQPAEVWLLDPAIDGAPALRVRSDSNPQTRAWARGTLRELSWPSSRDGHTIHGVLVLPPGHVPGTPLPTLVQIHGGPAWAWSSGWLGSWHDWAQLLASHGHAVLLPNPRGSEGQGQAFTEAVREDWGGGDLQDVLDGLDLLVEAGIADPARVAIGGWSYGGYLAAWAVARTDRFRTAIVGAGVSDIGAMALTTDTPDYLPGYFGDPLARREVYDRHSPVRHVDGIGVPVLILHGEADTRVPVSQGEQLHGALRFHGTPVTMVRYPRGPHWFHERAHERDVLARVLDWLKRHLGAAPND